MSREFMALNTHYSITFTPSHECIPRLVNFIIDMEHKPIPEKAQLLQLMQQLNELGVRNCEIAVRKGSWCIEFTVNENRRYNGIGARFDVALEAALESVQRLRMH